MSDRHDEGARFELHIEKGRSLFGKDAAPFEAKLQADARCSPVWTVSDVEVHQAKQIMELAALDMKPGEIAQELGISKATVYRRFESERQRGQGRRACVRRPVRHP